MEVLIVGAGDVGRWFGRTLDATLTFADVDATRAAKAASELDAQTTELSADSTFDLVVVSVPMSETVSVIEAQGPRANAAIIDLAGVMVEPLAASERVAPALERASFHPLFAPEHAPGTIALATAQGGETINRIRNKLELTGNEVVDVEPADHDRYMETVQGAAHAAILAYGLAAESVPKAFDTPVSRDLFELLERVTDGNPRVYSDIQAAFDGAGAIARAAERLAGADEAAFETLYREAKPDRDE